MRNVDEDVLRKFKAKTMEEKIKMGEALTEAMKIWVKEREKTIKPDPKNFLKLRGIIKVKGKKKVRWSEEIDKTLYGAEL